jgi:hypothetical protein
MAAQIREQAGNEQFEGEGGHHDSTRVTAGLCHVGTAPDFVSRNTDLRC